MSLSDFTILQKLGDGSYSSVYKVKRTEDGLEYALKKGKGKRSQRGQDIGIDQAQEIYIQNVASYKQAFFDEPSSSLCIVMEYADNGDVFQKICQYQQTGNLFKEKIIWKIFIQTVRGLKALHDLKILHRDMKSANIFLYRDYTAKLGDLNVSKVAKKGLLYTQTGTPYYASPEVWKDQPYDCKSDIWSLGCVLYEMCSLVPPFRADDMNGLFKRVLKGAYPQIPSNYSMDMRSVIKCLLQVAPAQRPNTEQILDMPIIQRRIKKYFKDETMNNSVMTANGQMIELESELLKTIKFSKNLFKLKLPQPTYDSIQFATMPTHNFASGKGLSRNNHGTNQTMSTTTADKTTSLPKISINGSSRNNNMISVNSHSSKSQVPKSTAILNQSIENVDETAVDDEQYEQDFEYDDQRQQHSNSYIQPSQQQRVPPHHNQYSNIQSQQKQSKARSYSGRGINIQEPALHKNKAQAQLEQAQDYNDATTTYGMNTNRSKSTVSHNQSGVHDGVDTPSQKQIIAKNQPIELVKGSNFSPSQQMLEQAKKKKTAQQLADQQSAQQHQATPIDEKAELESQYEEDFEKKDDDVLPQPSQSSKAQLQKVHKGNLVKNVKSGKRSIAAESVNASLQNQDLTQMNQQLLMNERPSKINRDNSQGSNGPAADQSILSNVSVGYQKSREERKLAGAKSTNIQHPMMSRSPSDQSIEKTAIGDSSSIPRSLQPSTLGKNIIIKPMSNIPPITSQNQQSPLMPITTQKRPSPNMDRIVNIYSINSNKKIQKKKFYLNMGQPSTTLAQPQLQNPSIKEPQPGINDDIRVKLRQLREGIGYYEAKSNASRNNGDATYDNPSHRNGQNSSVLLPDVRGSLSPGAQYNSNNSLIGKKPSLDRILRGISNESQGAASSNVHRIYRKVFANNSNHHQVGAPIELSGRGGQYQNMPMKVRPSGINIYRGNQNASIAANGGEMLDIQGKSVINK